MDLRFAIGVPNVGPFADSRLITELALLAERSGWDAGIGGRWPNRRPFRRAARWDGLFATHSSFGKGETMPPEELSAAVQFANSLRTQTTRVPGTIGR